MLAFWILQHAGQTSYRISFFIMDCADCWFKYSVISLLHGLWTALNGDVRYLHILSIVSILKLNIFLQYFFL